MLIIQTVFLHLQKRASVASNNDNVYKFINTAKKKPAVLGFLWILSFSLHFV